MDLYIETLTGTAFELRVSPFETIMSVKAKIQRLEGIPVSQQHLIWQSRELEDDYCLHDYSVHDGATLKLVLALRGGPINTRRIPMEDSALREMAEYMEANQEELLEKLPGNRQVTLLVFREGDQLNFFRVVDRGDGTLSPLSESLSGTSVYNLYEEEDEEEAPQREKVEENMKMREKMSELRSKLENMTVAKRPPAPPKKTPHPPHAPHPPHVPHPPLTRLARHSLPSGRSLNRNVCLPPLGVSPTPLHDDVTNTDDVTPASRDVTPARDVITTSHDLVSRDVMPGCSDVMPSCSDVAAAMSTTVSRDVTAAMSRDVTAAMSRDVTTAMSRDVTKLMVGTDEEASSSKRSLGVTCDEHSRRLPRRTSREDTLTLPARKAKYQYDQAKAAAPAAHAAHAGSHPVIRGYRDIVLDSLRSAARHERRKEYTLESLSSEEARAMSGLLRQASIERLGQSRISAFPAPPRAAKHEPAAERLAKLAAGASLREPHPPSAGASRLLVSPHHRLPPVKPGPSGGGGAKKKEHKRCYLCGKKTGLVSSYVCRCGNNYCTLHRYAEAHDCTFDYKTEGRKLLEQTNPVVSAPKLPKI